MVHGTAGADAIDFSPTASDAGSVTIGGIAVNFATTESVTIDGQEGGDALTITTPAGFNTTTLTSGATADSGNVQVGSLVAMNYTDLGAGSLAIADPDGVPGDDSYIPLPD